MWEAESPLFQTQWFRNKEWAQLREELLLCSFYLLLFLLLWQNSQQRSVKGGRICFHPWLRRYQHIMVQKGKVSAQSFEKGTITSYCNLLDYEQTLDHRPGLPIICKGNPVAVCNSTSEALCPEGSKTCPNQFHQLRPWADGGGGAFDTQAITLKKFFNSYQKKTHKGQYQAALEPFRGVCFEKLNLPYIHDARRIWKSFLPSVLACLRLSLPFLFPYCLYHLSPSEPQWVEWHPFLYLYLKHVDVILFDLSKYNQRPWDEVTILNYVGGPNSKCFIKDTQEVLERWLSGVCG